MYYQCQYKKSEMCIYESEKLHLFAKSQKIDKKMKNIEVRLYITPPQADKNSVMGKLNKKSTKSPVETPREV